MIPLIIYGMATWRISAMVVSETGPGDIFVRFRSFFGIIHDDDKRAAVVPDGFLPGLLSCVWCSSVWIGALWMIFDLTFPWLSLRLATAFAFSTAAILIQHFIER